MTVDDDSGKFFTSFIGAVIAAMWAGAAAFHFLPDLTGKWWGIPAIVTVIFGALGLFFVAFVLIAALLLWVEEKLEGKK